MQKLGLEGLPPACYDIHCRSSQVISHMEAGVGGCTAQQAVDLAHTEIRIQLTILCQKNQEKQIWMNLHQYAPSCLWVLCQFQKFCISMISFIGRVSNIHSDSC